MDLFVEHSSKSGTKTDNAIKQAQTDLKNDDSVRKSVKLINLFKNLLTTWYLLNFEKFKL